MPPNLIKLLNTPKIMALAGRLFSPAPATFTIPPGMSREKTALLLALHRQGQTASETDQLQLLHLTSVLVDSVEDGKVAGIVDTLDRALNDYFELLTQLEARDAQVRPVIAPPAAQAGSGS